MKRRTVDSNLERQFLIGMVTSKPFLATAAGVLDLSLVEGDPFRQVAEWCVEHFREYSDAPGRAIESIYHAWVERHDRDEDALFDVKAEAIHDLLETLSDQYDRGKELNVQYLLDELGNYLSLRKLHRLRDDLDSSLAQGEVEQGLRSVVDFSSIDLGKGAGIDVLNDPAAWRRAFADPMVPLISFPGAAGRFLNPALTRDSLVGIQGPEKRGKTYWCIEFVMRALRQRRKVAFFQVGDLSEGQVMLRLGIRLSAMPLWKEQTGEIQVPIGIEIEEGPKGEPVAVVETRKKLCPHVVSRRHCMKACRRFMRGCGIPQGTPYLMTSVHANSSINVVGIEAVLDRWVLEKDFVPDVVVIDYADILAPEDTRKDARDQVNDTWKALRRLSQERHCLVLAPSQADAASYDIHTQTMKNFSEDKRKLAHVTGMLGLNQSATEKEKGVMRLNWVVLREYPHLSSRCLYVAQCLPLARAFCVATM